jgi:hypothetical protein
LESEVFGEGRRRCFPACPLVGDLLPGLLSGDVEKLRLMPEERLEVSRLAACLLRIGEMERDLLLVLRRTGDSVIDLERLLTGEMDLDLLLDNDLFDEELDFKSWPLLQATHRPQEINIRIKQFLKIWKKNKEIRLANSVLNYLLARWVSLSIHHPKKVRSKHLEKRAKSLPAMERELIMKRKIWK